MEPRETLPDPWADLARLFRAQGEATNWLASVAVRLGFQVASVEAASWRQYNWIADDHIR